MATNIYDPCTNSISGETFQTISFSPDSYIMQWTVQPKGYVPFEHVHLHQDEIFHVEKGEIRIQMQGIDHVATRGESIIVPRGMAHIAYNNKDEILDCKVEYKPALDHDRFMQCFMGLTHDQLLDKKRRYQYSQDGLFSPPDERKMYDQTNRNTCAHFQHRIKCFLSQRIDQRMGKII